MSVLKDLQDLVEANVITEDIANDIKGYYQTRNENPSNTNRLFIVFGILGAILVGLGIILIIAHNWDELSKPTKTFFAFLPLLIGQFLCGYTLFKKKENMTWRESTSTFLFFAVGASISLVSQIYNIPGDLSSFLLTWMLIILPIIYLMRSGSLSLLVIVGLTYYACESSYWSYPYEDLNWYWLLLVGVLPFYYLLLKNKTKSNFTIFHNWIIPLSLTIVLGTLAEKTDELMYVAYFSLFGIFYLIADLHLFHQIKVRFNGYKVIGSLGSLVLLFILSFDWFWEDLQRRDLSFERILSSQEFFVASILTLVAGGLLYFNLKNKRLSDIKPMAPLFLFFVLAFLLGISLPFSVILINIYVFVIGILTIREGSKRNHLGILNYGLIIITILVACRFFDTDLSFVIRGILFVSVGAGFFFANYLMLKKRKNEQ
nr:DUF2157 domain-containing protein [uncultured Allomuricauda sp.]